MLVLGAMALGSAGLIVVAIEGAICIVLAAPLGSGAALLGALLGRALALRGRRSTGATLSAVALLPIVFAGEDLVQATTRFDTVETIAIAAPPERVWQAVVHMAPIEEPPALPFRLGIAYPVSGDIVGEGIGALRRGVFSTGSALERVTAWVPERALAFTVLSDVPSMRELSPYGEVHAPHDIGYFRTTLTRFELSPRADGGTDVVERTAHELHLEPVLYWLPLARWVVHQNNARALAHLRRQAERNTAR